MVQITTSLWVIGYVQVMRATQEAWANGTPYTSMEWQKFAAQYGWADSNTRSYSPY